MPSDFCWHSLGWGFCGFCKQVQYLYLKSVITISLFVLQNLCFHHLEAQNNDLDSLKATLNSAVSCTITNIKGISVSTDRETSHVYYGHWYILSFPWDNPFDVLKWIFATSLLGLWSSGFFLSFLSVTIKNYSQKCRSTKL